MLLLFLCALIVVAGLSVTAVVGTNLAALTALLAAPGQLALLARDRQARRNLALAHATVHVLEQRIGHHGLVALARPEGFVVRGGAPPPAVADAASEALARLRAGERALAIAPRSAVALLATEVALAGTVLAVLLMTDAFGLVTGMASLVLVALLGPRLSALLQRRLVTGASAGSLAITAVQLEPPAGLRGLLALVTLGPVLVRTADARAAARVDRPAAPTREPRDAIGVEDFRVR